MGDLRVGKRLTGLLALVALTAAACSTDGSGGDEQQGAVATVPDRTAEAAQFVDAPSDSVFPEGVAPDVPVGSYGFSRYVWTQGSSGVLPTLVEGPRGDQVRCQDEDLPCSYTELRALAATGDPVPSELEMTGGELADLVEQLDTLSATLDGFESVDDVCAGGYGRSSSQNPNMGIHMTNASLVADGFIVDRPEIILLGRDGGETLTQSEIGRCEGGRWTGDPTLEVVGAAYMVPMTPDHPEGFAGSIDNWHVHYNTCAGADDESGALADPADCEAEGGRFMEVMPVWMMHAYANPDYDSQQGVFSMFNGSIWPVSDTAGIRTERTQTDLVGGVMSPITDFSFSTVEAEVGEDVVFSNGDSVPHTVTSGTPDAPNGSFDSGVIGSGEAYTTSFDRPGEYAVFCTLHPQMTGRVIVKSQSVG
jgi:plastocyanin